MFMVSIQRLILSWFWSAVKHFDGKKKKARKYCIAAIRDNSTATQRVFQELWYINFPFCSQSFVRGCLCLECVFHGESTKLCIRTNWYSELKVVLIINSPPLHYPVMTQMNNWKFTTATVTPNVWERHVSPSFSDFMRCHECSGLKRMKLYRMEASTATFHLITNSLNSLVFFNCPLLHSTNWSNNRILIKRNSTEVFRGFILWGSFARIRQMCINSGLLWSGIW